MTLTVHAHHADCDIVVAPRDVEAASAALSLRNHLCVRDALRSDVALREEYAAVNKQVAATAASIDEYGRAKNATVQKILAAGGLSAAERELIDANQVPSHEELPR
jgi:GrpB-like predicted nucleotidyltransferase (UPF0157 family)